jgi:hypothetical protein
MRYFVVKTAARFIQFGRAYNDYRIIVTGRLSVHQSLRPRRFIAADHANSMEFIDVLRNGHQDGHRTKRLAAKIGIEASHQHADAA